MQRTWVKTTQAVASNTGLSASFRLMNWNLLANSLVDEEHQHRFTPSHCLSWNYRKEWIIQHIRRVAPDIVCVQELDSNCVNDLNSLGMETIFHQRRDTEDGCAILWNRTNFTKLNSGCLPMWEEGDKLLDRGNVMLWIALEHQLTKRTIIVATTHILFNPSRGDIKLAQIMRQIDFLNTLQKSFFTDALIWAGDFNLLPFSPLYAIIGKKGKSLQDVTSINNRKELSGQSYSNIRNLYLVGHNGSGTCGFPPASSSAGIRLPQKKTKKTEFPLQIPDELFNKPFPIELSSAYREQDNDSENSTGEPIFTTIHAQSKSCVDYIWYINTSLELLSRLEMPLYKDLCKVRSMPTESEPSDHFPLVCEFSFKST